ncbi:MAG: phosphomannomutase/phosphoglucomutase [Candidatus Humimicrobiia bacterium]
MRINPQIFREYDIRGIVGKDLTAEVVKMLGKSFGTYMISKGGNKVSVGRDNRLSSPKFKSALIGGILSTGCDVIDIGLVPTPVMYFSLFNLDVDGGIVVTGSHNPPNFNGFKLAVGKTTIYGDQIKELGKIIKEDRFIEGKGTLYHQNIKDDYINYIKDRIDLKKKLKLVIDAGSGTAGLIAPKLLKEIGCEVIELYCELDGTYPHHHPDPTVVEFVQDLVKKVKEEKADLGIAYDGDADRIGVIDDKGSIIWGDHLLILFSRDILKKGREKIIFEVKCSQALVDEIEKAGGEPIMWKTGHSLIKNKMIEEKAVLAGEMSGHIFFADNYYGYDDAIFASCRLVELLSESDKTISEMLSDIPKYFSTPEIRVDCTDERKFKIVDNIKDYFKKNYKTIDVDGVRILFTDGWGLVRASNTQPAIVLRFEGKTKESLKNIKNRILEKLSEYPSLAIPTDI